MKLQRMVGAAVVSGLLVAGLTACVTESQSEARLAEVAKIGKPEAEKIALAKVPGGTIKEGGIEKEKGKLVWSFDIASPSSPDITEVQVDALSGEVVSLTKETPSDEAKEKKKEKEDDEKEEKR